MDQKQKDDLTEYWQSKVEGKRSTRKAAYANVIVEQAAARRLASTDTIRRLFTVAIDNLGELSVVFRDIVRQGWEIGHERAWAEKQITDFETFSTSEKAKINEELAGLARRNIRGQEEAIVHFANEIDVSNRVHVASLRVMVHELISSYDRMKSTESRGYWIQGGTLGVLVLTTVITFWSGCISDKSLDLAKEANNRTLKLFVEAEQPKVQAIPAFIAEGETRNSMLTMTLINYTAFPATNVSVDVEYVVDRSRHRHWAGEYHKARKEYDGKGGKPFAPLKTNHGVSLVLPYPLSPSNPLQTLKGFEKLDSSTLGVSWGVDALDLETQVCASEERGLPVFVRVRWESDTRRVFDEVHQYKLLCTKNWIGNKDLGGRSFTMIPEDDLPESLRSTARKSDK